MLTSRYVKEVIRSYINCKEAHGRTKQEIDWKLEILELEVRISRTKGAEG